MSDLKELIAKCERATGPDPEIDHALRMRFDPDGKFFYSHNHAYTSSIDAALAFCERVLPGVDWAVDMRAEGDSEVWYDVSVGEAFVQGKSAPLAIILATLKALEKDSAT